VGKMTLGQHNSADHEPMSSCKHWPIFFFFYSSSRKVHLQVILGSTINRNEAVGLFIPFD
jgi:hypothetical protein